MDSLLCFCNAVPDMVGRVYGLGIARVSIEWMAKTTFITTVSIAYNVLDNLCHQLCSSILLDVELSPKMVLEFYQEHYKDLSAATFREPLVLSLHQLKSSEECYGVSFDWSWRLSRRVAMIRSL